MGNLHTSLNHCDHYQYTKHVASNHDKHAGHNVSDFLKRFIVSRPKIGLQ